jgi:hypothetical protein
MQVKKKFNHGGVHSWPPDTEVMPSDNTAVALPQLNFLTQRLLGPKKPSEREQAYAQYQVDQFLNPPPALFPQEGAMAQKTAYSLLGSQRERQLIEAYNEQQVQQAYNQRVQKLMDDGFTEVAAMEHINLLDKEAQMSGRVEPVYPLMDFTPVGDVAAMAGSAALALQGRYAEAGVGAGLATASIFLPGRINPAHAMADDQIRTLAIRNAQQGIISNKVPDVIEYIQEAASTGNISFGRTRSSALGGGQRAWTEPQIGVSSLPNRGYMRDFFDRPQSQHVVDQAGGTVTDFPYQSGRSLADALGVRNSNLTDLELQQTRDIINNFANSPVAQLHPDQREYYQGLIDGLTENLPGGSARQLGQRSGNLPSTVQSPSVAGSEYQITSVRQRPGATTASGKPLTETVNVNTYGKGVSASYRVDRNKPKPGEVLKRMETFPTSGFTVEMKAYLNPGDGGVDHDFLLQSNRIHESSLYKDRYKELLRRGDTADEAAAQVRTEADAAISKTINAMFAEVPVGDFVATRSYSTDSYPLMLRQLGRGKYKTVADDLTDVNFGPSDIRIANLNNMGDGGLFRTMNVEDYIDPQILDDVLNDPVIAQNINKRFDQAIRGRARTKKNEQAAQHKAMILELMGATDTDPMTVSMMRQGSKVTTDQSNAIAEGFTRFVNDQIAKTNDDALDALIREEARVSNISLQQAEIKVMNEFVPLPQAFYDTNIRALMVPVPRIQKIRAQTGAYIKNPRFKLKKKKAAYGMRVKK